MSDNGKLCLSDVQAALADSSLSIVALRLLAVTHNEIYELQDEAGQRYIMRLHQPDQANVVYIRAELAWLQYLARRFCVPQLLILPDDQALGWVSLADGRQSCYVIFHYHVGDTLNPSDLSVAHMRSLGCFLGQLHKAAQHFVPASGFQRPRLDATGLFEAGGIYDPGPLDDFFSPAQQQIMTATIAQVIKAMQSLGESPDQFGLIHGDLLLKNTLWQGLDLCALDFEYCGWSYFLYDLAPMLWQLKTDPRYAQLQAALWESYCEIRPVMQAQATLLETLIAARQVASMRWLAQNRHLPAYAPVYERLIQHRSNELSGFLDTGILTRKPLPA